MKLNTSLWGEFKLGDDKFFEIKRGESEYIKNMSCGEYPYISTTKENNGISAYVSEKNRDGNLITLAYDGSIGACFYQKKPFFASEKIVTIGIKNYELNEYVALFLIQILKLEAEMYSYGGRKWTVEQQLKNTILKLPKADSGYPDYKYMEKFIKDIQVSVDDIPDYFLDEGYKKACWYLDNINQEDFEKKYSQKHSNGKEELFNRKWKEFDLKDFFTPVQSKGDIKTSDIVEGNIPLISAIKENNGVVAHILCGDGIAETFKAGCLTADMFGHVYYQPKEFFSVSHGRVNILIPKIKINQYIGLFISNVLEYQFSIRNSYSRMLTNELLQKCKILLPTDMSDDNIPDWKFMEKYIKGLPFSCNI